MIEGAPRGDHRERGPLPQNTKWGSGGAVLGLGQEGVATWQG